MYYLLEDNRIIDSKNIRVDLDLPFEVDFYVQKDEIVLTIDHIYFEHISIIKKVENVYDLIEVGDLVRYFDNIYEIKKFEIERQIVYMDTQNGLCLPSVTRFMELLNAIYKPDSKGNYIKAWEKKEDE